MKDRTVRREKAARDSIRVTKIPVEKYREWHTPFAGKRNLNPITLKRRDEKIKDIGTFAQASINGNPTGRNLVWKTKGTGKWRKVGQGDGGGTLGSMTVAAECVKANAGSLQSWAEAANLDPDAPAGQQWTGSEKARLKDLESARGDSAYKAVAARAWALRDKKEGSEHHRKASEKAKELGLDTLAHWHDHLAKHIDSQHTDDATQTGAAEPKDMPKELSKAKESSQRRT